MTWYDVGWHPSLWLSPLSAAGNRVSVKWAGLKWCLILSFLRAIGAALPPPLQADSLVELNGACIILYGIMDATWTCI